MAKHIDVDVSTLYNWRRFKPELFRIVMLGFKFDELIVASKQNYDELCEYDSVIQAEIQRYKITKNYTHYERLDDTVAPPIIGCYANHNGG